MRILKEGSFSEACFNQNSVDELLKSFNLEADLEDCKVWSLTHEEHKEQIKLALVAKIFDQAEVTDVQVFDMIHQNNEFEVFYEYSANIAIDDQLLIQISGNREEAHTPSIPHGDEQCWNNYELQNFCNEHIDGIELFEFLEIENNIGWLNDNETDCMNPENKKYRF